MAGKCDNVFCAVCVVAFGDSQVLKLKVPLAHETSSPLPLQQGAATHTQHNACDHTQALNYARKTVKQKTHTHTHTHTQVLHLQKHSQTSADPTLQPE